MEKNTTNEKMKGSHPIAAGTTPSFTGKEKEQDIPEIEIERDKDEQVHESINEVITVEEIDLDEVIHQQPGPSTNFDEADPDDLVHSNG